MLEALYVIFVLLFMSGALFGLFTAPLEGGERSVGTIGERAFQIVSYLVYLPAVVLILWRWRSSLPRLADCTWGIALIGLALASALWAVDPLFVLRKSVFLAASTAFGIYLGTRYRRDEQIALLCFSLGLIGAMSIVTVAVFPQYGLDPIFTGDWRGVFVSKNVFGKAMVLGALTLCLSSRKRVKSEVLRFVWLVGFIALIVMSGSKTAAVAGAVLLVLTLMYSFLRFRITVLIPIMAAALLAFTALVTVVAEYRGVLLGFLGRDETLTGRVELWDTVLAAISRKPLLGYGFMSFWNGLEGPSASVVDAVGWVPPHAHNGFLDLCLDLGALGLLIFGIGFVLRFRTAILEYRALGYRAAMWPLSFLSYLLLYNLTESSLLRINSLYWALYMASLIREVNCSPSFEQRIEASNNNRIEMDKCPA